MLSYREITDQARLLDKKQYELDMLALAIETDDYNPKSYGITMDGTADDTEAWAAFLEDVPSGATVLMPSGTTLVDQILINKVINFKGQGPAATSIKANAGATGPILRFELDGVQLSFTHLSGFTLDMSSAPTVEAMSVADMGAGSIIQDIFIYKGSIGLSVGHCGNLHTKDVVLVGQTTAAVRVNGDDSAELFWDDVVIDTGGATLSVGFEIYRDQAPDIGGHYLTRVKITSGGGAVTTPFYFHSSVVNSFMGIEMGQCVGDGAGITAALHAVNVQTMQATNNWFAAVNAATNDSLRLEGVIYGQFAANRLGGAVSFDSACDGIVVDASNLIQWGDYAYRMPASGTPTNLNLEALVYATLLTNDLTKLLTATGSGYKMGKNSIFAHRIILRDTAGGVGLPFLQNTSDQFQFWGADGQFKGSIANGGIFAGVPLLGFPDQATDIGSSSFRFRDLYVNRNIIADGLPTSNPGAGKLWVDTGAGNVLKLGT